MFHGIEVFFTLAAVVGGPLLAVLVVPTLAKRFLRAASPPVERLPADPDDLSRRVAELAERLRGGARKGASREGEGNEELIESVEQLRREVAELAERVDFTERLLGQQRGAERLGPPRA